MKYFRLLEIGERRLEGDFIIDRSTGAGAAQLTNLQKLDFGGLPVSNDAVFRPIVCDEWQDFAKRQPTREDYGALGRIEVLRKDRDTPFEYYAHDQNLSHLWPPHVQITHWRKITPPAPIYKSKKFMLEMSDSAQEATLNHDGSVRLNCGTIKSQVIDEFIKAREEAIKQ